VILDDLQRFVGRQVNVVKDERKSINRYTGTEQVRITFDVVAGDEVMMEIEKLADEANKTVMAHLPGWATTTEVNDNRLNVFFTRNESDEFFIERFSIG